MATTRLLRTFKPMTIHSSSASSSSSSSSPPTTVSNRSRCSLKGALLIVGFFTLLSVAGSLLGSILCFVEGGFIVLESYFQYFQALSQKTDQGHIMHLLIEATDMFLVGTAMLLFGVGMYVMFMGSKAVKDKGPRFTESNLFGLFYMKLQHGLI
ncbi:hypothetical protein ACLB2K_018340 [Fragaria x ananassa]